MGPVPPRAPVIGPEVTVREDLATGVDALYVVTAQCGTDPARLAREVAADYLDGAGMVVVEAPLRAPRPGASAGGSCAPGAGAGRPADDGCDLIRVYRDLAEHPPSRRPVGPARLVGADPALAAGLVAELAASLALGARFSGLADLLPDEAGLRSRVRSLLPGPVRWAALRREDETAYVLWQRLTDPFRRTEMVDLVDTCGAARGVTELLVGHVAATERTRRVRAGIAVSPTEPSGWQALREWCAEGWTIGSGRWRFAMAGEEVLPWRAAPLPWRRAALAAAERAAG